MTASVAAARADQVAARPALGGAGWRPGFERAHWRAAMLVLVGLIVSALVRPIPLDGTTGAALLLVGGALLGMPHGSSDFVVAHRLLAPRLSRGWLPAFLAGYLLVTGAVLLGWHLAPGATFAAFLGVSALHFGAGEDACHADPLPRFLARAATPILPIFLLHPDAVGAIVGLMVDRPGTAVAATLDGIRPVGLALYGVLLAVVAAGAAGRDATPDQAREAAELLLLAAAAVVLPPLVTFAVYFCLLHAVRHMTHLGHDAHPRDGRAALRLAAAVVGPSAIGFALLLGLTWNALGGTMPAMPLVAGALQLTAALTIPHVLLEWAATRRVGPGAA